MLLERRIFLGSKLTGSKCLPYFMSTILCIPIVLHLCTLPVSEGECNGWCYPSLETLAENAGIEEQGISVYPPGQLEDRKTYRTKWSLPPGAGTSRSNGTQQLLGNPICY